MRNNVMFELASFKSIHDLGKKTLVSGDCWGFAKYEKKKQRTAIPNVQKKGKDSYSFIALNIRNFPLAWDYADVWTYSS